MRDPDRRIERPSRHPRRLEHAPSEHHAAKPFGCTARGDLTRRLALCCRRVHLSLAGDDEVAASSSSSNPSRSSTVAAPRNELGAESGSAAPRPPAAPGRKLRIGTELLHGTRDGARGARRRPPTRLSAGRRAGQRRSASSVRRRARQSGPGTRQTISRSPAPPSTVATPPNGVRARQASSRAQRARARRSRGSKH